MRSRITVARSACCVICICAKASDFGGVRPCLAAVFRQTTAGVSYLLPLELTEEEIDGALALIDSLTREDLQGPEFRDAYTEALAQIIEAKREDRPLPEAPEAEAGGKVLDLTAALQESVQKAQASRGEGPGEVHELPKKKTAAKKAAKKQPAKQTAAKKTTKKAAAKKTTRRPRSA